MYFLTSNIIFLLTNLLLNVKGYSYSYTGLLDDGPASSPCIDLHPLQRNFCKRFPEIMDHIRLGVLQSLNQCSQEFVHHRWNCSVTAMKKGLRRSTKETAYVQAITSAGVMRAVTKACSSGNTTLCSCARNTNLKILPRPSDASSLPPLEDDPNKTYYWAGCSDNVADGERLAALFMDATVHGTEVNFKEKNLTRIQKKRLKKKKLKLLSMLHNNKAGRKAVHLDIQIKCRCHGISGSCSLRSCWRVMPSLSSVSATLKQKYHYAVRVSRQWEDINLLHKGTRRQVHNSDLVFWQNSPSYCHKNLKVGSEGTQHRQCSLENGLDSQWCNVMCCNRGYLTEQRLITRKCHCKFHWCCQVKCQTCTTETTVQICK